MAYEDWFNDTFGIDTSENTDYGTGGSPGDYSGYDYDTTMSDLFGDQVSDFDASLGDLGITDPSSVEPQTEAGGNWASRIWGAVDETLQDVVRGASTGISRITDLFTTKPTTTTSIDPVTRQPVTRTTAGGEINNLGQQLIVGAITSLGSAGVAKWQQERVERENRRTREAAAAEREKDREFEREKRGETYRRLSFGAAPQLGVRKGMIAGG